MGSSLDGGGRNEMTVDCTTERVKEELAKIAARGPLTHKQMTQHLRNRIKHAGIKARVQMKEFCGGLWIDVIGATYEQDFTEEEQRTIRAIAKHNCGLTWAQGMEIDVEQMTNLKQFKFVFHGPKHDRQGER